MRITQIRARMPPPTDAARSPWLVPVPEERAYSPYPNRERSLCSDVFANYANHDEGCSLREALAHSEACQRILALRTPAVRHSARRVSLDSDPKVPAKSACARAVEGALRLDLPSPNDPFAGTDLAVVRDDYVGELPDNVIRASGFARMLGLYRRIERGESRLRINFPEASNERDSVLNDLRILLTRPIGRALLEAVEKTTTPVVLQPGNVSTYSHPRGEPEAQLQLTQRRLQSMVGQTEQGERYLIPSARFRSLAHELIHHLHEHTGTRVTDQRQRKGLIDEAFTNLEEQYTITGWRIDPTTELIGLEGNYYRAAHAATGGKCHVSAADIAYSPINEWAVCRAFGLPTRKNHESGGWFPPGVRSRPPSADPSAGSTPIRNAIKAGAFVDAIQLVNRSADLTETDYRGRTVMHDAAGKSGSERLLRRLVAAGCAPDAKDVDGNTPMREALLAGGNPNEIRFLLGQGIDANNPDQYGFPPLALAAGVSNNTEVLQALLEAGARTEVVCGYDLATPLIRAVYMSQDPAMVAVLLAFGADVNAVNGNGDTALVVAHRSSVPVEIIKLLTDAASIPKRASC